MQTNKLPVCNIGLFNNSSDFWIDSIEGVLKKYPALESAHINTFYTILILEKASGKITFDHDKLRIDSSQIIILKPNCINKIYLNADAKGGIICFTENFFSLRYNNNVLNQFPFFNEEFGIAIKVSSDQLSDFISLISNMLEEFTIRKKASKKVLRSYLNILLIELDRIYIPLKTVNFHNPIKDKVQKYQKLIEENFKTHKKPSDYAEILNISTNYLNKICKNLLGQTAGSLIHRQVILEAQRLLSYTTNTIKEIANELGFEHTSYFVTFFRKMTNQTPEQYRKSQQE